MAREYTCTYLEQIYASIEAPMAASDFLTFLEILVAAASRLLEGQVANADLALATLNQILNFEKPHLLIRPDAGIEIPQPRCPVPTFLKAINGLRGPTRPQIDVDAYLRILGPKIDLPIRDQFRDFLPALQTVSFQQTCRHRKKTLQTPVRLILKMSMHRHLEIRHLPEQAKIAFQKACYLESIELLPAIVLPNPLLPTYPDPLPLLPLPTFHPLLPSK